MSVGDDYEMFVEGPDHAPYSEAYNWETLASCLDTCRDTVHTSLMTTTTKTQTAGAEFAATMLRNFGIGARTRRVRDGANMVTEIMEAIERAAYLEGYYSDEKARIFRTAFAPISGYQKHILGYRIDGQVIAKIQAMSPRQFVLMLADMIDAGVGNMGEAETYFNRMR